MLSCCVLFFFSSRRRHTRCLSDWSSDVCSSDLRAPFLWATLPLVAVGGAEKIAFNTSYLGAILADRMMGGASVDAATAGMNMDAMTPFTLTQLVSSPGLWIGLLVATAFLAGAIRLRRQRGPI